MDALPVLAVQGYGLAYRTSAGPATALADVSLRIDRNEVLGLVGESGSGKTSLAYAILRDLPGNAVETGGRIVLDGEDLRALPLSAIEALRGKRISMVFQDPSAALNPTMTLGAQLTEVLARHQSLASRAAYQAGEAMLARVGLRDPPAMMRRYPHEASGGEKQRVVIATAFACRPACVLMDEPTTALDVITARQILALFRELQGETGTACLYISHDLALVATIADRVAVIHRGRIVEEDPADAVFQTPREDYTRRLVGAVPRPDVRLVAHDEPVATAEEPLLALKNVTVRYGQPSILARVMRHPQKTVVGARDVSLTVARGEILGLVGESGSGKSTVARTLVGLHPFTGEVRLDGRSVRGTADMDKGYRRAVQIVFQHPDSSLNPRMRVAEILARPLKLYGRPEGGSLREMVAGLLEEVRLPADFAARYPHQLSGGEKQRVAIARAFAARPRLVICDEITSSLDVSVQASVIELLLELRRRFATAYLFITHDLNLVRQIAHRIAVIYRGDIVETLSTDALARGAQHPYTRALIEAVPTPVGKAPAAI